MAAYITDRQRDDLHNAVLEYLLGREEFAEAASVFQRAANIAKPPPAAAPGKGLLEKKWTSVVRLQKKVMDLEAKLAQAEQDLAHGVKPDMKNGFSGALAQSRRLCRTTMKSRVLDAQVRVRAPARACCRAHQQDRS